MPAQWGLAARVEGPVPADCPGRVWLHSAQPDELAVGRRAGTSEHSLGAAQGKRANLCCRGACLGWIEQWLGEGQCAFHLRVAFDSQAGVTRGHGGTVALTCSTQTSGEQDDVRVSVAVSQRRLVRLMLA